jgi:hypothetical protein
MKPIILKRILHLAVAVVIVHAHATPAGAQDLIRRATKAARSTAVGQEAARLVAQAQLIGATHIDLEASELPTVPVGVLVFGVSGVDVKNHEGVRLHAYLYNATSSSVTVPAPDRELLVLVDQRGRRLEPVSSAEVGDTPRGAGEITVPALERVAVVLLYGGPAGDATTASLKVGELGVIPGIPVHTRAAPGAAGAAGVWTQPTSAPPPPSP